MIQQKQIELYVFLHSMRNGILTVSPSASIIRQVQLPIHEVEVECAGPSSSKILLRIPEYMAIGKGLISPTPFVMTPTADEVRGAPTGGFDQGESAKVETRPAINNSPVKPVTPAPLIPMTEAPTKRFDEMTSDEQDRHILKLIKPKINQIDDEIKASGGLNGGQA